MMPCRPSLAARRRSSLRRRPQHRLLCVTAAAAIGSSLLSCSSLAFSPIPLRSNHSFLCHHQQQQQRPSLVSVENTSSNLVRRGQPPFLNRTTRLYSFSNKNRNEDGGDGGLLGGIKKAAKSILPKSWFQTKEEKQAALERKRFEEQVSGGIQQVLRDAPLPIRMLGGMISPLLSSAASTMAQAVGEQQQVMDALLDEARVYLVRDGAAVQALGEPISVSAPFSQSSSTVVINGKTSQNVQAAFNVVGNRATGVCNMEATQDGITFLTLNVNGRNIPITVGGGTGSTTVMQGDATSFRKPSLGKNPRNQGDIIDVEFEEKKK